MIDWAEARAKCQPKPGETLRQKQSRAALMHAYLVLWANEQGYEVTQGDAFRDPRVHGEYGTRSSYSAAESLHKLRLAKDLNLFKGGQYQTTTEAHRPLGNFWRSLSPDAEWGGEGTRNDANHYSVGHDGNW